MSYMLEAEDAFDDRSEAKRCFIGRMFGLGFDRISRRFFSISIRARALRYA